MALVDDEEDVNQIIADELHAYEAKLAEVLKKEETPQPILEAAMENDLEKVKQLMEKGLRAAKYAQDMEGRGLTHFAAMGGSVPILKFLQDPPLELALARKDKHGRQAIHFAAAYGQVACVKWMVEQCEVPCESQDLKGRNPFHLAALEGKLEVIQYLFEHKASTEGIRAAEVYSKAVDQDHNSALHFAAQRNQVSVCKWLVAEGVRVDPNLYGNTPLDIAEKCSQKDSLYFLSNLCGTEHHIRELQKSNRFLKEKLKAAHKENTAVLEEMSRKQEAWEEEKRGLMRRMQELKAIADEKVGAAAHLETQLKNIDIYQKQLIKQHQAEVDTLKREQNKLKGITGSGSPTRRRSNTFVTQQVHQPASTV